MPFFEPDSKYSFSPLWANDFIISELYPVTLRVSRVRAMEKCHFGTDKVLDNCHFMVNVICKAPVPCVLSARHRGLCYKTNNLIGLLRCSSWRGLALTLCSAGNEAIYYHDYTCNHTDDIRHARRKYEEYRYNKKYNTLKPVE